LLWYIIKLNILQYLTVKNKLGVLLNVICVTISYNSILNKVGNMENLCRIVFPESVRYVIEKLNSNDFEAYLVGGCVRDSILGRVPCDWDITTNALPENIKGIFEKTYDTGIKHGTVSVVFAGSCIEVTTYRIDGEYSDNRRPDSVKYTSSLKEDLARRDFTVNAMAYHPKKGLVDYFNGLNDLNNAEIKAVGDANLRFGEDALRMLRAIRFSAQLGFKIKESTYEAISSNSGLISNISNERIRDELNKILISSNPMYFDYLYHTGILRHVMPEFEICYKTEQNNPYHVYNVAGHIMHTVKYVKNSSILRWTMLLHDIGKPLQKTTDEKGIDHFHGHQKVSAELADVILNRLRFDKESIKKITNLILNHDIEIIDTEKSIRKVIGKVGEDAILDLIEVQIADAMSQNRVYLDERLVKFQNIKSIYYNIKNENQCLNIRNMAINGDDLILLGMTPGKEMKDMLNYLFDCVLETPQLNNKQKLMDLAKRRML
jgi:tRNA nucleotidyltransferase (CCA-adding enzyme)